VVVGVFGSYRYPAEIISYVVWLGVSVDNAADNFPRLVEVKNQLIVGFREPAKQFIHVMVI